MEKNNRNSSRLILLVKPAFLPVATTFIEKSALALGLEEREALMLTLAGEEVFLYLCQEAPEKEVEIHCTGGGYFVQAEFKVPVEDISLKAFNFSIRIKPNEDDTLEDLGLVLASRSVDRFQIREDRGQGLVLRLIKEKKYPEVEAASTLRAKPLKEAELRIPNQDELKILAQLGTVYYSPSELPPFFRYPGKMVDMNAQGEFKAVVAVDPLGHIGGGVLWSRLGLNTIVCSGPYLFDQPKESQLAEALIEAVLKDVGRSSALGLMSRHPTRELPISYFEPLGTYSFFMEEGRTLEITAYFRQLREDEGSLIWSHPQLEPFLRNEMQRMVLPREIQPITAFGEKKHPHSVLATEVDRERASVTLTPMRPGADQEENLSGHLQLLRKEGWRNVFFEMDLALSWQVEFTPALFNNHFTPRLLLPYAGQGDVVIFQAEIHQARGKE